MTVTGTDVSTDSSNAHAFGPSGNILFAIMNRRVFRGANKFADTIMIRAARHLGRSTNSNTMFTHETAMETRNCRRRIDSLRRVRNVGDGAAIHFTAIYSLFIASVLLRLFVSHSLGVLIVRHSARQCQMSQELVSTGKVVTAVLAINRNCWSREVSEEVAIASLVFSPDVRSC